MSANGQPIQASQRFSTHSATYKKEEAKRTLSGDARIVLF